MLSEEVLGCPYVTVPHLEVNELGERLVIHNHLLGTRLEGSRSLLRALEFFRRPNSLKSGLSGGGLRLEDLQSLVESAMLLDFNMPFEGVETPVGRPTRASQLWEGAADAEYVVFGAPTDTATTGDAGARHGPSLIRSAFAMSGWWPDGGEGDGGLLDLELRRNYARGAPRIADVGNVRRLQGEAIRNFGSRIRLLVDTVLERGARPVLLGGDHSVTHFVLESLLEKHPELGIIHFDAHHDTWPPFAPNLNYVSHNNPFVAAIRSPHLKHLVQIGLRTVEFVRSGVLVEDPRLRYVSGFEAQTRAVEELFATLPRDIPWYLTFDIDCLSPTVAPDTGTPVPGGLGYYRALELVDHVARNFELVGMDIVEVAGNGNQRVNPTAMVAARLLMQMMLGKTPFEPLTSYFRNG
jgi:agmatinase